MKSKGQSTSLLLVVGVIVGVYVFGYYINVATAGIMVGVATYQDATYVLSNTVRPARLYLETALHYSVYQACYENLKRGGYKELGSQFLHWYDSSNSDISEPEEKTFLSNLAGSIKEKLNVYTKTPFVFLSQYSVALPEYTGVEIEPQTDGTVYKAQTNGRLSVTFVSKDTNVMLYGDAQLSEKMDFECISVYKKGIEVLQKIKSNLQGIENEIRATQKTVLNGDASTFSDCKDFFASETGKTLGAAEQELDNMIQSKFSEGITGDADFEVSVEKMNNIEDASGKKAVKITAGQGEMIGNTVTCRYEYKTDFDVNVRVTRKGGGYPVSKDAATGIKEVVLDRMALLFLARESYVHI